MPVPEELGSPNEMPKEFIVQMYSNRRKRWERTLANGGELFTEERAEEIADRLHLAHPNIMYRVHRLERKAKK